MDKLTILKINNAREGNNFMDTYVILRSSYPISVETSPNASSYANNYYDIYSYNNGAKTFMKQSHTVESRGTTYVRVSAFVNSQKSYIEYSKPQYRWYFICIL